MGTTLNGTKPKNTYQALLKTTDNTEIDATLKTISDGLGTDTPLQLSTDEIQINSTLRVHTDSPELLDIEDTLGNNRFNINRVSQKINLDFASRPTDITTQVGAIRTAIDGTNLADVVKFQENGQVTFTERVKLESDSTVTTQTSSVIQSSTTNANLVIAPNGTGALVANIPDGTATGGNARGTNAVDFQLGTRDNSNQVASGIQSVIINGTRNRTNSTQASVVNGDLNLASGSQSFIGNGSGNTASGERSFIGNGFLNTASSQYATVSGGQSNTASTNTHATVVGGFTNAASGQYSVAGGNNSTVSGARSFVLGDTCQSTVNWGVALGRNNTVTGGDSGVSLGFGSNVSSFQGMAICAGGKSYIDTQFSQGGVNFSANGDNQSSIILAKNGTFSGSRLDFTTGQTALCYVNNSVSGLLIPLGNNRAWNVQVNWVAIVTTITGTATGISVGDVVTSIDLLAFKKIGGVSSASAHTSTATKTMVTTPANYAACAIAYTAGASQEMALTFTGPTFVGGGSVTMRVVARIELAEVAF